MKILLVTGIFPPDHGGPAGYVPRIASALHGRGHEIAGIITLSDSLSRDDTEYPFPVFRIKRAQRYILRWTKTVAKIIKESRKADVVYLNGLVLEGIVACKLILRRPVAIKVVGDLIWERARNQKATKLGLDAFQTEKLPFKWSFLRMLQGAYTALADIVITPSSYLAGITEKWGVPSDKIKIVYNAAPLADISSPVAVEYDLATVARLVPWKGVHSLIDISAKRNWSLRIVGDGPLREELEKKAAKLSAKISFAGQVPKEKVANEIRKAKLFVLNSEYEGLPHIVLEAKSAKVAVVASSAGGTPETVKHGEDGWLVPVSDAAALESAIDKLLRDDVLRDRLAEKGREDVEERFGFQNMVNLTEGILRGALK